MLARTYMLTMWACDIAFQNGRLHTSYREENFAADKKATSWAYQNHPELGSLLASVYFDSSAGVFAEVCSLVAQR